MLIRSKNLRSQASISTMIIGVRTLGASSHSGTRKLTHVDLCRSNDGTLMFS